MYEKQSISIESKFCVVTSGALQSYQHEYFLTVDGVKSAFDEKTIFEISLILDFSLTNYFIFIHRYIFKPITDLYSIYLLT